MTSLDELYETYLRPLNLEWQLTEASRRRLILASALPGLVIAAELVKVILTYSFSPIELSGEISSEPWHRIYVAASNLQVLSSVAVAVLFFAGLRRWSRADGTWMFLVGALLASVAIFFGSMAILVLTAIDDEHLILDLRVRYAWLDISNTFGFISIGFFFVAYRGLSQTPEGSA